MKTRNKLIGILTSVFLACCCAIGITQIKASNSKTAMAETTPSITIESKNLSYSDSIYILYAVSNEGFDRTQNEIQMLFWNEQQAEYAFGTQDYVASTEGDQTVNGKDCLIFYSDGIAAKEMTDDIYVCAYATIDGVAYYSDVIEYSVEKYVAEMREKGVSTELETLFDAMLDYGAAAQALLEGDTTNAVAATSVEEASSAETGTSIAIESNNVSYAESMYILYAISNEGFDRDENEIQMLFWNEPQTEYVLGTESYSTANRGSATVKGKDCLIFYSDGIAAKEMTGNIYARAYATVDGVACYSEVTKFSVLEYVYQMREKGGLSEKMETLFTAMLNYGAAAQVVLSHNTDRPANATYYKVSAENGELTDGTTMGRYLANETVTLRAGAAPGEGYRFLGWYDGETPVSETETFTLTVEKSATYTAQWTNSAAYTVNYYLQNVDDDNYTLIETQTKEGTIGTTATAELYELEGTTFNASKSTISGTITIDGSLVLSVYYDRNVYTVATVCGNEKAGSVSTGGAYKIGKEITLTATTNAGYTFGGWYEDKTLVSSAETFTHAVEKDVTYTAIWSANTDTAYTVKYYWKKDGATEYTLYESVQYSGETDTVVTAVIKTYDGYVYDEAKSADTIRGTILGDGSLVLKVYYVYDETQKTALAFEAIDDSAYKVVGIGTYKSGVLTIPSTYNEKPVTAIGAEAFYNVRGVGELVLPDSVTTIEDYAFASCLDLTKVTMGNGVTSIGKYAFAYCNQMDTITFSDKLVSIDENAFYGCLRIKSLAFPDTLTTIAKEAFKDCKKVQTITFGTRLATIGEAAFYRCESLKSLTIPDGAPTNIGARAFMNCSSILKITLGNGVTAIGDEAFSIDDIGSSLKLRELVIGDGVTKIGEQAFSGARKLVKVTLGSSVSSIGQKAFYHCFVLHEVYNESSLTLKTGSTTNGYIAFYAEYAYNYSKWWNTYTTRISQDNNGFYYYTYGSTKKLIGVVLDTTKDIVVPDDVTEIATYACYNETYITGVTIGSGCTTIGEKAFGNCYNIRKLNLSGSSLTTLAQQAFYNNEELSQVIIGDSVTTIGEKAFSGCIRLTSVEIGKGVTTMGENAFNGCDLLTNVYIKDIEAWCNISGVSYLMAYGSSSKNLYLNDALVTNLVIPEGVTSIGAYAFANFSNVASVTIPSTVTSIGDNAFYKCGRLVEVINKSALTVEKGADTNGYVGYYALSVSNGDDSYVSKLSYDDGYIVYTDGADKILVGYPGVKTDLVMPENITKIYNYAFYDSNLLTNIYITDLAAWCKISGLTYLMKEGSSTKNLYLDDELVTNLVISKTDGVTSIGNYAFYNCDSLKSVVIEGGVTSIGKYAFCKCSSLTSVEIGANVTSIGNYAFYDCSSLTSITFKDTSWYRTTSSSAWGNKTGGTETDVSNPSTNATYFTDYAKYYWYAKDHSYEATVTAPTCTENGYTTYTCSNCGYTYTDDEVAATGHSYKGVVTAPTCTTAGYTTYTCACGDAYKADEVAATGHNYVATVTPPTCTTAGYTTYTCACGDTYTADEVAATGHSYEVTVTAPTCTENGYNTYTCSDCGDTYTTEVAATGHNYVDGTCSDCGAENHVHKYTAVVTEPTCTEDGYTTYTCACGDTYTADEVAATGHNYVATVTPPTCTEDGYTTHTCDKCDDTYTEAGESARGEHIYEDGFVCDCGAINGALGYFKPEWLK